MAGHAMEPRVTSTTHMAHASAALVKVVTTERTEMVFVVM